jgi:uncharacterized protein with HEPN domain
MSRRSARLLLEDILEAIDKIDRYVFGMTSELFQGDDKTIDAVVRNLEVIGEAASRLPTEFREENQQVEWAKIVGLRNRIVHEYFGVDTAIIWQIVQSDLPQLKDQLERLISRSDKG